VAFASAAPERGQAEIERLATQYPSQRMQALRARAILMAREAGRAKDLRVLDHIVAGLPEGDEGFLARSADVRNSVAAISREQTRITTIDRAYLKQLLASALVKESENFRHRISEPLASEFAVAANNWELIARGQLEEANAAVSKQPVMQPFRAGDPVKRDQEAFVYRDGVMGQLDQQLTLASGCPGLVLYARRRMGKSTLLENLDGFLPSTVRTQVISMQDPTAFNSLQYLVEKITQGYASDLPGMTKYLNQIDQQLDQKGNRWLLAIDEYEAIDGKIREGVLPIDLLAAIRESIQKNRRIIWLFAGSHAITELAHANWTSYLVSARTIEIPPFSLDETRLLLTDPLKYSRITTESAPRFDPRIWGEGGIEKVHDESGGWPHLVQLIAETIVDLLNNRPGANRVTSELMEQALDRAVEHGQNALHLLMEGECRIPGEWAYLSRFGQVAEQDAPADSAVRRSLKRRMLVLEHDGKWRLRAPLMARWVRKYV
jgi:hypothetical protein